MHPNHSLLLAIPARTPNPARTSSKATAAAAAAATAENAQRTSAAGQAAGETPAAAGTSPRAMPRHVSLLVHLTDIHVSSMGGKHADRQVGRGRTAARGATAERQSGKRKQSAFGEGVGRGRGRRVRRSEGGRNVHKESGRQGNGLRADRLRCYRHTALLGSAGQAGAGMHVDGQAGSSRCKR